MNLLDNNDSDISEMSPVKLGHDPKIDWFHFETKMRSLIQEMLEPVIRRNSEDSQTLKFMETIYDELKEKHQESDSRIQALEESTSEFAVLDNRINELRGNRKLEDQKISIEFSNFHSDIDQMNMLINQEKEIARSTEIHWEKLNNDIASIKEQFFELKEKVHLKIIEITDEVNNNMTNFNEQNSETNSKLSEVVAKFENVTSNIDEFHLSIEQSKDIMKKLSKSVTKWDKQKVDSQKFETTVEEQNQILALLGDRTNNLDHKMYMLEEYWDKYMPMKIQSSISGAITPVLSPKKKKVLEKAMSVKLEEMRNNLVSQKSAKIDKKLNMIAKASGRKNYDSIKTIGNPPKTRDGIISQGKKTSQLAEESLQDGNKMSFTTQSFGDSEQKQREAFGGTPSDASGAQESKSNKSVINIKETLPYLGENILPQISPSKTIFNIK